MGTSPSPAGRSPFSLRSLRMQLLLWVALPVAIGLFALSLTELRSHEQAMARLLQERADSLTSAAAALIANRLDREQDRLLFLLSSTEASGLAPNHIVDALVAAQTEFGSELAIFDEQGQLLAAQGETWWTAQPAVKELVLAAAQGKGTGALSLANDDKSVVVLAAPFVNDTSYWALAASLPVDALDLPDALTSLALHPDSTFTIHSADGQTILRRGSEQPRNTSATVSAQAVVPGIGWQVRLHESWAGLAPPLLRFESVVFTAVALAVVISLLSAYFGLRNIVQPLRRLHAAAASLGSGDFELIQQPVGGVQETADLQVALAQMAREIQRYQNELQSYIGAITQGQEEERRRLARELHDETVQILIALNQQVELIERRVQTDLAAAIARLQELRPLISEAIAGLRRQIHDLRPLYLEDLGFVPALEMLLRQVSERSGLIGDVETTGEPERRLPPALETDAFRIVQEALQNVASHGQASWVHVALHFDHEGITLVIEDDGIGFQAPAHPFALARAGHYGLMGMQERAQLHGGWLKIESVPGQGTTLTARLLER